MTFCCGKSGDARGCGSGLTNSPTSPKFARSFDRSVAGNRRLQHNRIQYRAGDALNGDRTISHQYSPASRIQWLPGIRDASAQGDRFTLSNNAAFDIPRDCGIWNTTHTTTYVWNLY